MYKILTINPANSLKNSIFEMKQNNIKRYICSVCLFWEIYQIFDKNNRTRSEICTGWQPSVDTTLQPRVLYWLQTKKKCILIIIRLHLI